MKILKVKIPDMLYLEMEHLVKDGWFGSKESIAKQALTRFLHNHRPEVLRKRILEEEEQSIGGKS